MLGSPELEYVIIFVIFPVGFVGKPIVCDISIGISLALF